MPLSQAVLRAGLLASSLVATPTAAQVTSSSPQADQSAPVHRFIDRFNAANTTHDGRLTLEQAQAANMPMLVRHFNEIDTQHKGYVTLPDIQAWRQQVRAGQTNPRATTN